MNRATTIRLNRINQDFYRATAAEFDRTRQGAWQGWERLLPALDLPRHSLLDLGCGNGRFGAFLAARQTQPFTYIGVDSNADLLARAHRQLARNPIIKLKLIDRDIVLNDIPPAQAQLVVLFGLIHHVPGFANRRRLLASAAQRVLPGGCLVFAAWRFYERERFRRRIVPWPPSIAAEAHDYLLDWRRGDRALRYCHYVDDAEHAQLIAATGMPVSADFRADGAEGDLNRYTVLQKGVGRSGSLPAPPEDAEA